MPAEDKVLEVHADTSGYYYAYHARPLAEAEDFMPSTSCRPRTYCNPYCNRADTHWYTMGKAIPPDQPKTA